MYAIGTVTKGAGDDAHYRVLAEIKALAEAVGWTTLRYDTGIAERELILHSDGPSGTEDIHIGFKAYQSVPADYYNLIGACMTGYVAANAFESQPGYRGSGVPCHNLTASYYMTANKRRIVGAFRVGGSSIMHFYQGKFLAWARPGSYGSPLVCAGQLDGRAAVRYSDPQWFPYKGLNGSSDSGYTGGYLYMRDRNGSWSRRRISPFSNASGASTSGGALFNQYLGSTQAANRCMVPADADAVPQYQPEPLVLYDLAMSSFDATTQTYPATGNAYGSLDGVYAISGFSNAAENVLQVGGSSVVDQTGMTVLQAVDAIIAVGGRAFVVLPDGTRNTWRDFVAVEMS